MGRFLLALALASAAGGSLRAQSPAPVPTPAPKTSPTPRPARPSFAQVRFWNLLPAPAARSGPAAAGAVTNELQVLPGEGQAPLASETAGSFGAGYYPVRPGSYTLLVRRPGADPSVGTIARLPANLRAGTFVTVIASERDGHPVAELIDDTPDPKAPADSPGRLTVRQITPGLRVNVTADQRFTSGELLFGEARTLEGLPLRLVPLTMFARPANGGAGTPRSWRTEVDFSGPGRRATLLVIADAYGRFRPRVTMDGPQTEPEPDLAEPAPGPAAR